MKKLVFALLMMSLLFTPAALLAAEHGGTAVTQEHGGEAVHEGSHGLAAEDSAKLEEAAVALEATRPDLADWLREFAKQHAA